MLILFPLFLSRKVGSYAHLSPIYFSMEIGSCSHFSPYFSAGRLVVLPYPQFISREIGSCSPSSPIYKQGGRLLFIPALYLSADTLVFLHSCSPFHKQGFGICLHHLCFHPFSCTGVGPCPHPVPTSQQTEAAQGRIRKER